MLTKLRQACKREEGFTLIELMIVVAIIGILAAVAVPNFIAYRNKSKVSAVVATAEGIRAALANFAADSQGNTYPSAGAMATFPAMAGVLNGNGGAFSTVMTDLSIAAYSYSSDGQTYSISLSVDVPNGTNGRSVSISPSGITKLP